jgi:glycosyltransferase involved in cell wall biosynthesis
MNIFLFTETQSGCYKWRGAIPAKYLRKRGHDVQIFADQPVKTHRAPDVMVFYRAHFAEAHRLVEFCKRSGIRVVFDTDDALDLVPRENLNYKGLQSRMPVYEFLLREADIVTTTTATLAGYLRKWNPNVSVVPNSVDPEEWQAKPRNGDVRIGWTGSPTHFADLAVAMDAIRELQKKYAFTFVLQGICMEPTLDELFEVIRIKAGRKFFETPVGKAMKRFREKLDGIRYEFHPNVPIAQHPAKVCDMAFDIGIAPLTGDIFNQNKSCIKYYEYAMSGAVTVASDVLPYSTEVPITARNKRESWIEKLEYVLNADREALLREQRDWVMTHRNIEKNVELWEQAFSVAPAPSPELQAALQAG